MNPRTISYIEYVANCLEQNINYAEYLVETENIDAIQDIENDENTQRVAYADYIKTHIYDQIFTNSLENISDYQEYLLSICRFFKFEDIESQLTELKLIGIIENLQNIHSILIMMVGNLSSQKEFSDFLESLGKNKDCNFQKTWTFISQEEYDLI